MIKRKSLSLFLILTIVLSVAVVFIPQTKADGEAWLTGWDYRESHTITNMKTVPICVNISSTSADSGAYINVDASKLRSDFGDVRFTDNDGSTQLSYWMENSTASVKAWFWVTLKDDYSASSGLFYIYYGNVATTTSNGFTTFPTFDNFDDASLNTTLWDNRAGSPTETGGFLGIPSSAGVRSTLVGYNVNAHMRCSVKTSSTSSNIPYGLSNTAVASSFTTDDAVWGKFETDATHATASCNDASNSADFYASYLANTLYLRDFVWSSGTDSHYINDVLKKTYTVNVPNENCGPRFGLSGSGTMSVDWVFVRYYYASESHGAWGGEEAYTSTTITTTSVSTTQTSTLTSITSSTSTTTTNTLTTITTSTLTSLTSSTSTSTLTTVTTSTSTSTSTTQTFTNTSTSTSTITTLTSTSTSTLTSTSTTDTTTQTLTTETPTTITSTLETITQTTLTTTQPITTEITTTNTITTETPTSMTSTITTMTTNTITTTSATAGVSIASDDYLPIALVLAVIIAIICVGGVILLKKQS
jgi:hypothetical protein